MGGRNCLFYGPVFIHGGKCPSSVGMMFSRCIHGWLLLAYTLDVLLLSTTILFPIVGVKDWRTSPRQPIDPLFRKGRHLRSEPRIKGMVVPSIPFRERSILILRSPFEAADRAEHVLRFAPRA
eukprot:scaffold776_cov347-Pavlova_lutheri.AAC.36